VVKSAEKQQTVTDWHWHWFKHWLNWFKPLKTEGTGLKHWRKLILAHFSQFSSKNQKSSDFWC